MVTLQMICLLICMSSTKLILRKPIPTARIESSGFKDIGLKNGSNTASSLKNMQGKMPSRHPGEILCTKIFNPGLFPKPSNENSILAWFTDQSQRMLTLLLCRGVAKTISSSAITSSPKTQLCRTRRNSDLTTLVRPFHGKMAPVKPMITGSAPSTTLMASSPT